MSESKKDQRPENITESTYGTVRRYSQRYSTAPGEARGSMQGHWAKIGGVRYEYWYSYSYRASPEEAQQTTTNLATTYSSSSVPTDEIDTKRRRVRIPKIAT